jgi:hypothetical protein
MLRSVQDGSLYCQPTQARWTAASMFSRRWHLARPACAIARMANRPLTSFLRTIFTRERQSYQQSEQRIGSQKLRGEMEPFVSAIRPDPVLQEWSTHLACHRHQPKRFHQLKKGRSFQAPEIPLFSFTATVLKFRAKISWSNQRPQLQLGNAFDTLVFGNV